MKKIIKGLISLCVISNLLSACAQKIQSSEVVHNVSDTATDVLEAVSEITSDSHLVQEVISGVVSDNTETSVPDTTTLEEVTLVSIVDGDTLTVLASDGLEYKVRLIGIDTPESVHSDASRNNEFGVSASKHTKDILKDVTTLYLEYDVQVTDKYSRTLAYVWLSDDQSDINNMLNAKILSDGYAIDKVYEPNHKYAEIFAQLCQAANESHIGLWQTEGYHALVNR